MLGNRLKIANKKAIKTWTKYYPGIEIQQKPNQKVYDKQFDNFCEMGPCLGKYRKTKVFCSSPFCCGNPRKIKGSNKDRYTKQELLAEINEIEQLMEFH